MKSKIFLSSLIVVSLAFFCLGCNSIPSSLKGKYFVGSEYIISYASQNSITTDQDGNKIYGIDIIHKHDIKLNYLSYKCELYSGDTVIETFEGEIEISGFYAAFPYIPVKTTKQYDHAKVVCTGYSDENPSDYVRLNAMTATQMRNCQHKNLITATIKSYSTNSKKDFIILNYSSTTILGDFCFFYEGYPTITSSDVKVCANCGFYSFVS